MTNLATPLPETQVRNIPLEHIQADPIQIRRQFTQEELEWLAASIRECGVIQPIVVQPTPPAADGQMAIVPFQIIAGERRWRASIMAGLETIPAVVREGLTPERAQVLQVIENLQRQDLTLHELSAGVSILVDKLGLPEAAKQLGQSKAWVSRHATLRELPEQVRAMVEEGKLESAEMAADLGKILEMAPDHWRTKSILKEVEEGKLTRASLRDAHKYLKDEQDREAKWKKQREEDQKRLDEAGSQEEEGELSPEEQLAAAEARAQQASQSEENERLDEEFRERRLQLIHQGEAQLIELYERICKKWGIEPERCEDTQDIVLPDYLDKREGSFGAAAFAIDLPYRRRETWSETIEELPASLDDVPVQVMLLLPLSQVAGVAHAVLEEPHMQAAAAIAAAMPPRFESVRIFLAQATKTEDGAKVESSALFEAYGKFCKKAKLEGVENANEFSTTLEILGQQKKRLESGRAWINLKLVKA